MGQLEMSISTKVSRAHVCSCCNISHQISLTLDESEAMERVTSFTPSQTLSKEANITKEEMEEQHFEEQKTLFQIGQLAYDVLTGTTLPEDFLSSRMQQLRESFSKCIKFLRWRLEINTSDWFLEC